MNLDANRRSLERSPSLPHTFPAHCFFALSPLNICPVMLHWIRIGPWRLWFLLTSFEGINNYEMHRIKSQSQFGARDVLVYGLRWRQNCPDVVLSSKTLHCTPKMLVMDFCGSEDMAWHDNDVVVPWSPSLSWYIKRKSSKPYSISINQKLQPSLLIWPSPTWRSLSGFNLLV